MSATITTGATSIAPAAIDGYESRRERGTIVHPILGSTDADITLRPAQLRTGTLSLVFLSETASKAAEDAHATGATFTLTTELDTVDMVYVVAGAIDRRRTPAGAWIVDIGYQEVTP